MPEPTHPPYESGALTIPRQLQRWLDINPQNGRLTRTRKFLLIPAFQISNINWRGFSEIVAEFHVTAPNNFSLKVATIIPPLNPSYTLTIAYVDETGTTFRYRLWSSTNEIIYPTFPQYTGQFIQSTFKIEIWSTPVLQITQANSIRIDTSVLGSLDYRYGVDEQLVAFTNACTGQQVPIDQNINAFDLPIIFNVCGITGGNIVIGTELSGGVLGVEGQ